MAKSQTKLTTSRQEDLQSLLVGHLLFKSDILAINSALLPEQEVQSIIQLHSQVLAYTEASDYLAALHHSGLQPGALLTGNNRVRLLQALSAGANAGADNTSAAVQAAFRGYDSCSVPLLLLVETLVEAAGSPAAFCTALLSSLPSWLDVERLQSLAPCITWDCLQTKLEQHPSLFEVAVWPVLSAQGWTISTNTPANGSSPNSGSSSSNPAAFTPPAAVTAAFHASTGAEAGAPASPTLSCSCPADVLAVLSASKAAVPEQVVAALRQAESAGRVAAMLAEAAAAAARDDDAPHRVCADPSGKLAGLPTSKRHLMCANCGATETRVWRVSNAGLMCCNACGTFWQKHHQHRPEHLLAANEAKRAAQRAASEAAASASDMCGDGGSQDNPDNFESPASTQEAAAADGFHSPTRSSKRQRTRRQPQRLLSPDEWELPSADGCDSDDTEALEHAARDISGSPRSLASRSHGQEELEALLQRLLGSRPEASADATEASAVAALVMMQHSNLLSIAPVDGQQQQQPLCAQPGRRRRQQGASDAVTAQDLQQQQQHEAQRCALAAAMCAALKHTLAAAAAAGGAVGHSTPSAQPEQHQQQQQLQPEAQPQPEQPASQHEKAQPQLASSLEAVWAQILKQASSNRPHADAVHTTSSPTAELHNTGSCTVAGGTIGGGDVGGRSNSSSGVTRSESDAKHRAAVAAAAAAAAAAAGFERQDSTKSSAGSFALPRSGSASSGGTAGGSSRGNVQAREGVAAHQSAGRSAHAGSNTVKGQAAGKSRFAAEHHHQAAAAAAVATAKSLTGSARGSAGKSKVGGGSQRSNGRRRDGQPAICANCGCDSTCLWRRDKFEPSRVLCNACGIYKATNGIDRPVSGKLPSRRHGAAKSPLARHTPLASLMGHTQPSRAAATAAGSDDDCDWEPTTATAPTTSRGAAAAAAAAAAACVPSQVQRSTAVLDLSLFNASGASFSAASPSSKWQPAPVVAQAVPGEEAPSLDIKAATSPFLMQRNSNTSSQELPPPAHAALLRASSNGAEA